MSFTHTIKAEWSLWSLNAESNAPCKPLSQHILPHSTVPTGGEKTAQWPQLLECPVPSANESAMVLSNA